MKNYKKYIGCLSLSVLTLIGCEDLKFGEKFLDKPISNEQNIDSVFNKKVYAEQALAETDKSEGLSPKESRLREMVHLNMYWFMQTLLTYKVLLG